jgi:hypothetical protein
VARVSAPALARVQAEDSVGDAMLVEAGKVVLAVAVKTFLAALLE